MVWFFHLEREVLAIIEVIMYLTIPQATEQCTNCYCKNEFSVSLQWTVVPGKKCVKAIHFSWLALDNSESLTKTATYNHCRMLCTCSMEHIAFPGGYKP